MKHSKALGAALALGLLATSASGLACATSQSEPRASIPFADHGAISNWEADREKGLWVQANNREWYYATFIGPCQGLDFAHTIGFDTSPLGSLDRWSSIVVPRWGKCTFSSFEPSDGPPSRHAKS